MFPTYFSILQPEQKDIWPSLAKSKDCGFVLYGGTALALRFGHRQSTDFDFFSNDPFSRNTTKLFSSIPILNESKVIQESENTLVFVTKNKVQISFFGNINFGCINYPDLTDDKNLYVASVIDIMGTKLKTLLQRISVKDYIDITEIIRRGVDLELGLSASMTLFKNMFPPCDAIRALTYFESPNLKSFSYKDKIFLTKSAKSINLENIHPLQLVSTKILSFNNSINSNIN